MNQKLIEYGIFQEKSDYRVHVCPGAKSVYMFPTQSGVLAIQEGHGKEMSVRKAEYRNIETARGYIVHISKIQNLKRVVIPDDLQRLALPMNANSGEKGLACVEITKQMIQRNLLPIQMEIHDIDDEAMQISGLDIVITTKVKIQVKCDYPLAATGNVFLQTMECNPFKIH